MPSVQKEDRDELHEYLTACFLTVKFMLCCDSEFRTTKLTSQQKPMKFPVKELNQRDHYFGMKPQNVTIRYTKKQT